MKISMSSEALSQSGAEKITFPPKPDRQTYRRTDISVYRVASLLKRIIYTQRKTNTLMLNNKEFLVLFPLLSPLNSVILCIYFFIHFQRMQTVNVLTHNTYIYLMLIYQNFEYIKEEHRISDNIVVASRFFLMFLKSTIRQHLFSR